jgi:hypothetical protein
MVRSCPLAELFSVLTQSGYSKSTQSRATKHSVGPGGKPRCDCVKQQNDSFVLRSQPCCQRRAASSVRFSSNSCAAIPILCALKLCSALAMFLTTAMVRKTPFSLYVTHFDRQVMADDSKAPICRHHDVVDAQKGRKLCHSFLTDTS